MPKEIKNKEEKMKINNALLDSVTQLLYICDVFGASRTMADLMNKITIDEKEGILSSNEARDFRTNIFRSFENAEKRCKCFEIPDIF